MVELAVIYLTLPDKRVVLQRRDEQAPTSPGKLGLFGGHIEDGETPAEAVVRELGEETSLDVTKLRIDPVGDWAIEADADFPQGRHTYLFKATVNNVDFKVFEGVRAETYSASELLKREDLTAGVRYMLEKIQGED